MKNLFTIIALFIMCGLQAAKAQQYPFRIFSIEQGLSESVVHDMIQDEQGYIWLGTGYGLNKFDGIRFQTFFEMDGLNSSRIRSLYKGSDGKIWIGSESGVNYVQADSIYKIDALDPLINSTVSSILEDKEGNLWFGTDGDGVWQFTQDQLLRQYTTNNGLVGNRIRSIQESQNDDIWIGTRSGITVLQEGNFVNYTEESGLGNQRIRDIQVSPNGEVWIGTRNGVYRYNYSRKNFEVLKTENGLINNQVQTITITTNGNIWIGTESGASFFNGESFKNYSVRSGLSTEIIQSSLIDNENNIWLGTYGGGVNLFLGDYFENYSTEQGLPNNLVTSFTEDANGMIWISTFGGGIVALNDGEFLAHEISEQLTDNQIYTLFKDSEERIWVGMGAGLAIMDNENVRVFSQKEFPYPRVRNIMETKGGIYWISTYDDGIIRYDGNEFNQISSQDGLISNRVLSSVEGDDGSVWIGTYGGVTRYKDGEFQSFAIQEGLPNNAVMNIEKDDKGRIWVSTFGGIAWFDGLRFQSITRSDGLPDDVCYFIHQNKHGLFWIGTTNGVVRFDAESYFSSDENKTQAFQVLNTEQGLIANELNLGAVFEDSKGMLWFGTVEGLSRFNPEAYRGNPVPPKVHITGINASGREYESGEHFTLSHEENYLEIQFSGINFTAPNQILYEYQLSDIDPTWQKTTSRSVKYPSLPPGEYVFKVHARNINGAWSEDVEEVRFSIIAPFWMQWWFWMMIIILVIGIIYLFYNYYRVRKMIDIERMRVRIASDLHDDVGASLTEIALQSDFLQATDTNPELQKTLQQIGKQSRKIVSSLDDIVWSIDARNDTLGDLTDRMQDYVLNTLEQKNMTVDYDFDNLNMDNKLPVSVKENVYLIFKEAVNNIAKYSNGNRVDIKMENNNGRFEFIISDNGTTGKGTKKTGHGLRNMDMRAKRIGANITIDTLDGFSIKVEGKLNTN
jgi:ligand-binding sensor domain-containing protein/two-component sensor histidine kinase